MNANAPRPQVLGAVAAALLLGAAAPSPTLPVGWREPTAAETASLLRTARDNIRVPNLKQNLSLQADFDGDGRRDRAVFLIDERRGEFAVFVKRASARKYERLDYGGNFQTLWNYSLFLEAPKSFVTACARGLGDASVVCRERVRPRWPAIGVAAFEASYVIYWWDGRRFDHEYLTD